MLAALLAATVWAPAVSSGEPAEQPLTGSKWRAVDRIVAVVEKQPLLLSELELEARVAFIRQGAAQEALGELSDEDLARTLDYVIGQRLAFDEAVRLQVFEVSDVDIAAAVRDFSSRFAHEKAYRDWLLLHECSEDQLAAILRRDLRVARLLESKVKLAARTTEEEIRQFYKDHAADFSDQPYAQVREGIRSHLTRERYRELTRQLIADLRARAEVRLLAPFARADKPPHGVVSGAGP
jgi:hypothetical protein